MGKIYDGESKLNVVQVCDALGKALTTEQAKVLVDTLDTGDTGAYSVKAIFAHMVLDAYRYLPNTTETDMLVKKYCKHLMEKYMKSSTTVENEETAFNALIETIKNKSNQ